jgi:hypothetical protein
MATCKECIHYDICLIRDELSDDESKVVSVLECEHFKDRSQFVELPCKAGDTIFLIIESSDILEYKVFYISILCGEVYDEIEIVLDRNYHRIKYTKGRFEYELGKTIFFTEEEAEQALKEREDIE